MTAFNISGGNSTTYVDATPGGGLVIDFDTLDNSFSVQVNGVDLFVGGPAGGPNELQFQTSQTAGQTVRFADGDQYETNTTDVWRLQNTNGNPVVRLEINPDGTIVLSGVKANNGTLEPLELFNGLSVNTAAIAASWNDTGTNTIVVDQTLTGPTNASGDFDDVPCFCAGSMISTLDGEVPVEDLSEGDGVIIHNPDEDSHLLVSKVRRIYRRKVSTKNPKLRPVRITAGALGNDLPKRDLLVSQQHRMLVDSKIAERMFGLREVLIPAIKLTALPGIVVEKELEAVEYLHLLFDQHEVIYAEGAPTESLFTGPEALKAISPEAREEITTIFPEIASLDYDPTPARHIPTSKQQKRLIARHAKNNKPCLSLCPQTV